MDAHSDQAGHQAETGHSAGGACVRFAGMMVLSFVAMYILMYAMVDKFADVYPNGNQAYMAALMTAPMAIFELLLMGSMYRNRAVNAAILVGACVVLVVAWLAIRNQTAIDDKQFVKSMIPHHSAVRSSCAKGHRSPTRN